MNGIEALGEAISSLADVNMDSELTKSLEIVTGISGMAQLSIAWSKQWATDAKKYYIDSLEAIGDPSKSATAAAEYSVYQEDLQQGQTEMGQQDTILQSAKTVLKGLGSAMDQVYSIMEGPIQLTQAENKAILILGS